MQNPNDQRFAAGKPPAQHATRGAPAAARGVFVAAIVLLALCAATVLMLSLEHLGASAPASGPGPATAASGATTAAAGGPTSASAGTQPAPRGFTGRYPLGPELAPIRIVVFMDYQCQSCRLVELELKVILEKHPEISLSVKQCPRNIECNPYGDDRGHVYSCAAARAAEAAGLLGGKDGFWRMHYWLFDHSGRFTDDELLAAAKDFGYDVDEFARVWKSAETLRLVRADIEEGFELGLNATPMVFMNGVEFKGWASPGAITRVIVRLSQETLPLKTAESDHPLPAREAFVSEWRQQRVRELPPAQHDWALGPAGAKLKIVVWGDYQQPNTALADGIIRDFIAEHAGVQYTFRPYPLNRQCNPELKEEDEQQYPLACRAAQAAVAAGLLNGADGYWKVHAWLLKNQPQFSDEALRAAAWDLGLDPAVLLARMDDPDVSAAVLSEAQAGQQAGLQHSPLMFLNGKVVPRWLHGQEPVLRDMLDAAWGK